MSSGGSRSTNKRRNDIVNMLDKADEVRISELSEQFGVSVVTIRKDLTFLEQQGLLRRTHGGAINVRTDTLDIFDRRLVKRAEKIRIAQAAANLVNDGDSIIINAGSTCHYVANELKHKERLFVITNSLSVAESMLPCRTITTFLLGGRLDHDLHTTTGDNVSRQLANYSADKLFMGMDGIDPVAGATSYNHTEDYIMHQMISSAKYPILVADDSKIGKASFVKIADLNDFYAIITNQTEENALILDEIEKMGVKVLRV